MAKRAKCRMPAQGLTLRAGWHAVGNIVVFFLRRTAAGRSPFSWRCTSPLTGCTTPFSCPSFAALRDNAGANAATERVFFATIRILFETESTKNGARAAGAATQRRAPAASRERRRLKRRRPPAQGRPIEYGWGRKRGDQSGTARATGRVRRRAAEGARTAANGGHRPIARAAHEAAVLVRPAHAGHRIVPDRAADPLAADADLGAGDLDRQPGRKPDLRAGARGQGWEAVHVPEISFHDPERGGAPDGIAGQERDGRPGLQDQGRSAYHAGGALPAQDEHRRTAAASEHPQGRHEHRRPAPRAAAGGGAIQRLRKAKALRHPRPDVLLADPAKPQRPELRRVDGAGSEVRAGTKLCNGLEDHPQDRRRGVGDEWGVESGNS